LPQRSGWIASEPDHQGFAARPSSFNVGTVEPLTLAGPARRATATGGHFAAARDAGWLDCRMPVASDLPMIEAVIVDVPNPGHPFGVTGVAEAGMVASLACIANAVAAASRRRMTALPIDPPKLLKAIGTRGAELCGAEL
jgi:hypothetical protein